MSRLFKLRYVNHVHNPLFCRRVDRLVAAPNGKCVYTTRIFPDVSRLFGGDGSGGNGRCLFLDGALHGLHQRDGSHPNPTLSPMGLTFAGTV